MSAMLRYAASVDDRDMAFCFLLHQEIGELLSKITKSVVEFLSLESPAQSASQKTWSLACEKECLLWSEITPFLKTMPNSSVRAFDILDNTFHSMKVNICRVMQELTH